MIVIEAEFEDDGVVGVRWARAFDGGSALTGYGVRLERDGAEPELRHADPLTTASWPCR